MTKTGKPSDGDTVLYRCQDGKMLGPFTVGYHEDGSVGLWYKSYPEQPGQGDHVHALYEDGNIVTMGPFRDIDESRLVLAAE